ncbi:rhomboid family intramembrane serine protease [Flavobacterium sp.]|uniref:rhomboid family intramembrane serine protease n=1 Tax=Flavobacterium sp. TaxID=239 RepID=UPI003529C1CF
MPILDDLKLQYKTGGIVQKLIFWNVGVFLLSLIFFYHFKGNYFQFPNWLSLHAKASEFLKTPWTAVTYMFVHAGFLHLLFNLIVLNFSGRLFTTFFTERQLFGVYILGGIFSGIAFVLLYSVLGISAQLVGASGAIMAVLVATAAYAPYMEIRLALIGRVKLWHITAVLLVIDLIQLPVENSGGHLAHLAGALFGFLYVKLLQNGTDLTKPISQFQDAIENRNKAKIPFKKVHKNKTNYKTKTTYTKTEHQQKIDEILDKISQSGYDSLTKAEKEYLFKAGN